jgi:hypothetical protein
VANNTNNTNKHALRLVWTPDTTTTHTNLQHAGGGNEHDSVILRDAIHMEQRGVLLQQREQPPMVFTDDRKGVRPHVVPQTICQLYRLLPDNRHSAHK